MPEANIQAVIMLPQVGYVLAVTVLNAVTEEPNPYAVVLADSTPLPHLGDGVYEAVLPGGTYLVKAQAPETIETSVTVELNEDKLVTLYLVEGPAPFPWGWIILASGGITLLGAIIYKATKKKDK